MVDRIDAGQGIEAAVPERQGRGGIAAMELGAILQAEFLRARLGARDPLGVQIEADHAAPGLFRDPEGRSARAACDVEQASGWG